jgi:hypothetical protein
MRLHISPRIDEGELPVTMNPGSGDPFGNVYLGRGYNGADITIESDEDADRIIRAMVKVKAMRAQLGKPHPFTSSIDTGPQGGHCDLCGMLDDSPDHAEPGPYDRAIQQAEFFAQPGNTVADILAEAAS